MAVKFAVRGDSLDARYSNDGATPGLLGTSNRAAVTTDEVGINGTNSIDMVGVGAGARQAIYNGRLNTPLTLNRSMLIRCKQAGAGAYGLMAMGVMTRNPANYIGISATAGGEVSFVIGNEGGAIDTGTSTGAALGTTAWKDIGISWDGTTGAGGLVIAVDGSVVLTDTVTRDLYTPWDAESQLSVANIFVGGNYTQLNTYMSVDEVVVWDEIIDFTANVTLTSGAGLLNGASRTAYVDVEALDGAASTGGGGMLHLGRPGFS